MVSLIIFFILMLVFAYLALKRPPTVIVLIFCMYAMEQWMQATNALFLYNRQLINVLVGSIVLFVVVFFGLKNKVKFTHYTREELLVYALFLFAFISIIWSPDPHTGFMEWKQTFPYMVVILILAPRLIINAECFKQVIPVQVIVGGVITLMLLTTVEWDGRQVIIGDEFLGNPLTTAQMAGYTILAATLFHVNKTTKSIYLLLKIVIVLTGVILIIKSGSRGQLIAALVSMFLLWPISYKVKSFKVLVITFLLLAAISYLIFYGLNEYGGVQSDKSRWSIGRMDDSIQGRLDQSFFLLAELIKNPMSILIGLGNSASYYFIGTYPHNVPLEILGEEGIIGFFLYFVIISLAVKNMLTLTKIYKRNNIEMRRAAAVVCSFTLLSFLLSLKQGSMIFNLEFFMMTMILGRFTYYAKITNKLKIKNQVVSTKLALNN